MIEKIKGNVSIAKLRAVLLLESDFNGMIKIIYNSRMLPSLETCREISYEVIKGRKVNYSQRAALNKKLVTNIGNQTRRPTVVMSTDATD